MRLNAIMWLAVLPIAILLFSAANARDGVHDNVSTMLGYYLPAAGIPIAVMAVFYFVVIRPKDKERTEKQKAAKADASGYWDKQTPSNDP